MSDDEDPRTDADRLLAEARTRTPAHEVDATSIWTAGRRRRRRKQQVLVSALVVGVAVGVFAVATTASDRDQRLEVAESSTTQPGAPTETTTSTTIRSEPADPTASTARSTTNTTTTTTQPTTTTQSTTTTSSETSRVVPLPSHRDESGPSNLLYGVLAGDRDFEGGCLWILRDDGSEQAIRWPEGYAARFSLTSDDFELLDGNGTLIASAGDTISFSGFEAEGDRLDRCHVGTRWAMHVANPEREPSS